MRRKRLALALAIVLGVLAAFLVAGFAVLELSPRDYRLVWMLKRTRKIEYSSPFARSTVLEIVKPDEVAEIVSAVTSKLNRRKKGVARVYGAQLRFVLDDGRDLTLATLPFSYARGAPELDEDARASLYVASAVRLPGAADIDEYETDGRALRAVHQRRLNEIQEHGDEIGRLVVDGREVTVEVRQRRSWEGSILRFVPDGVINRANRVSWELVTRRGTRLVGNRTTELLDDDLARVDVSFDGEKHSFEVPPLEHREPLVPACPSCRSFEGVMPLAYPGKPEVNCFHGRCRKTDNAWKEGEPELWCESCQKSF